MTTQTPTNNAPTMVAAFDSSYVLSAVFRSIREAAAMTGALRQSLVKAAYGDIISVKGKYWRVVPPDYMIEPDDVGQLTVFEFDATVGEDRRIYASKKMDRASSMLESEYLTMQRLKNSITPKKLI